MNAGPLKQLSVHMGGGATDSPALPMEGGIWAQSRKKSKEKAEELHESRPAMGTTQAPR